MASTTNPVTFRPVFLAAILILTLVMAGGLAFLRASPPSFRLVNARALTHDGTHKAAPILTDGARIIFQATISRQIASVDVAGGQTTLLSGPPQDFVLQDVSLTRSEFLGLKREAGDAPREVWVVPIAGETPRRVGDLRCHYAAWSANGRKIACAIESTVLLSDGAGRHDGSVNLPGVVQMPRWSPDGRKVRFTVSVRADRTVKTSVWEVNGDGSRLHQLLPGWNESGECCGNWTPDGAYYVFQAERNGRMDLWGLRDREG